MLTFYFGLLRSEPLVSRETSAVEHLVMSREKRRERGKGEGAKKGRGCWQLGPEHEATQLLYRDISHLDPRPSRLTIYCKTYLLLRLAPKWCSVPKTGRFCECK